MLGSSACCILDAQHKNSRFIDDPQAQFSQWATLEAGTRTSSHEHLTEPVASGKAQRISACLTMPHPRRFPENLRSDMRYRGLLPSLSRAHPCGPGGM